MFEQLFNASTRQSPVIIAEIGAKYAEMDVLKSMVLSAKDCGADVVKFQTYEAETISTPGSFFTFEDGSKVPQFDFFKAYELDMDDHIELDRYCKEIGIEWFSTPSHPNDVKLLENFDPIAYKTGSDDLTNLPFLQHLAETGRPLVVSTGMCTLGEIEKAVKTIQDAGNDQLVLLHCVVSYPSKPEDANLLVIETLKAAFGLPVGLSDHTQDEFTSVLATQLGVAAIEKHFTLDYSLQLPDYQASLDAKAFKLLVDRVRLVPKAMGNGEKDIIETEKKWRASGRKSIFSTRQINKGEVIQAGDLVIRRPADGIHPHLLELITGRAATQDIPENTLLDWGMV
jgi:sialic acid synthase SpsE